MSTTMQHVDKLLGPLNPNKYAVKTARDPRKVMVVNATEEQCASVCEVLIKDNKSVVYGLVEDASHPMASKLASMQVRIIVGDLTQPPSYVHHLKDLDAVFVHVEFDTMYEKVGDIDETVRAEVAHTRALVDACVKAGVKQLVYSTLDDLPDSNYVPHCHAKAEVAKYIKTTSLPATYLYTSTPFSIIIHRDLLLRQEDGSFLLNMSMPDDFVFPAYPTEQTGDWVKMALKKPQKWHGKDMHACTEFVSPASMARDLEKISKKPVRTNHIDKTEFYSERHRHKMGEPRWLHFRAILEGMVSRDQEQSQTIVPHQWGFKQWAAWSPDIQAILRGEQ